MIPIYHSNKRKTLFQWMCTLIAVLLFIAACCLPVTASRDVKVALTELKSSLYTDEQGKPTGFFVELVEDLAEKEDWNVIWISGTISESWERLSSGELDLMPGVTVTPDRLKIYDFNNESAVSIWSQVYAKPVSDIKTILDLDGKKIAMVRGASSGIGFKDYSTKFGINATYIEKDTPVEVFEAVADGEADALVVYNSASQDNAIKYGLTGTPVMFDPAQFGFAVLKGQNQDLLKGIDLYLKEGKKSPSSTYSLAMQRWYGVKAEGIIPSWIFWSLGIIACFAALLVLMSYFLRREVERKTAELAKQNEELQSEIANRIHAESELVQKNEELKDTYEQLAIKEEELRQNYLELMTSEKTLMQARKKLNLLNTLTAQDIKNTFYTLTGYIELSKESGNIDEVQVYLTKLEQILKSVEDILAFAEKFQNLGINQPRWQNFIQVFIYAISHLDFSKISKTINLQDIEIYADPLLEDVFLALLKAITRQDGSVTWVGLNCQQHTEYITILVESDGPGIPTADKNNAFTWENTGKGATNLFLAREILSITGISLQEIGEPGKGICFEIIVPKGVYRMKES